jgi:hypothetical protein
MADLAGYVHSEGADVAAITGAGGVNCEVLRVVSKLRCLVGCELQCQELSASEI